MSEEEIKILDACKSGLGISYDSTAFDDLLEQKIKAIQLFMRNAGVKEANLSNDLAIGLIVMGVADLWETQGGEVKFSPAFHSLISQLAYM